MLSTVAGSILLPLVVPWKAYILPDVAVRASTGFCIKLPVSSLVVMLMIFQPSLKQTVYVCLVPGCICGALVEILVTVINCFGQTILHLPFDLSRPGK